MEPWLIRLITGIIKLLIMVSIGCFIGTIFECRNWMKTAAFLAKPLIRLGRLPDICGTAFLTAFVSNPAANSMIAAAYADKKITRRDMILNGIANSYAAKVSHSMRISFALVSAFGTAWLAGIAYFAIQFFTGFLLVFCRFWTRVSNLVYRRPKEVWASSAYAGDQCKLMKTIGNPSKSM